MSATNPFGIGMILLGTIACVTGIGAVVGIPLIIIGLLAANANNIPDAVVPVVEDQPATQAANGGLSCLLTVIVVGGCVLLLLGLAGAGMGG